MARKSGKGRLLGRIRKLLAEDPELNYESFCQRSTIKISSSYFFKCRKIVLNSMANQEVASAFDKEAVVTSPYVQGKVARLLQSLVAELNKDSSTISSVTITANGVAIEEKPNVIFLKTEEMISA